MKLSKLFHTLYATVMALPVLIIPIFALNILHKETEPISIEVQEQKSVDFNQYYNINEFTQISASTGNISYTENDNFITFSTDSNASTYYWLQKSTVNITFESGHKYFIYAPINTTTNIGRIQFRYNNNNNETTRFSYINNYAYLNYTNETTYYDYRLIMYVSNTSVSTTYTYTMNIYDLSQMYGLGNEPTNEEFLHYFPNDYYSYTTSSYELINDYVETYDDTDIGSQFLYSLYKPVNDYFNFGEFFGLSGMYDWFQLNIFNGTAPLSFFIVFNVMIYWLFISLFWLLFDVLIYVPMVIHKWLDKAEM